MTTTRQRLRNGGHEQSLRGAALPSCVLSMLVLEFDAHGASLRSVANALSPSTNLQSAPLRRDRTSRQPRPRPISP